MPHPATGHAPSLPPQLHAIFPWRQATHPHHYVHQATSSCHQQKGALHHPAEDGDKLCHIISKVAPAPGTVAQAHGLQRLPWESIPGGASRAPGATGRGSSGHQ